MLWSSGWTQMLEQATPYIVGVLTILVTVQGWALTQTISHGKELVEIKTTLRFYLERTGVESAKILAGSTNPTPPDMARLLEKYPDALKNGERQVLKAWLQSLMGDATAAKGERSIAVQLLAAMATLEKMDSQRDQ